MQWRWLFCVKEEKDQQYINMLQDSFLKYLCGKCEDKEWQGNCGPDARLGVLREIMTECSFSLNLRRETEEKWRLQENWEVFSKVNTEYDIQCSDKAYWHNFL